MNTDELCHVTATSFHDELGGEKYPYEPGRYWLYTSKLCPFAHRTEITRALTGQMEEIGLTIADPVQTEMGWNLGKRYESEDSLPNPEAKIDRLPGIYQLSAPGYNGRASLPVLFDTKTRTIVNNESAQIIVQLDSIAGDYASRTTLYPEVNRIRIDSIIKELNQELISPIYRAGFAKDQETHTTNANQVFAALDRLESHLGGSGRYIAGEDKTLADVHAYPHLSRFDAIFHSLYRLNRRFINGYRNISKYLERLGAHEAFGGTLDIEASKTGYFLSWNQPTNAQFVPQGPIVDARTGVAISA